MFGKREVILSMTFSACVSIQLLAPAAEAFGQPATSAPQDSSCFLRREWTGGWKVTSDSRTLYIRVSRQIYQLNLDAPHPLLRSAFAVIADRGSNDSICSPLDFSLVVSDRTGAEAWPIVRTMRQLTPEQTSKLAKELRP